MWVCPAHRRMHCSAGAFPSRRIVELSRISLCVLTTAMSWGVLGACGGETCPPRFYLSRWCYESRACTTAGTESRCDTLSCDLPKGDLFSVPIAHLVSELGDRHALEVSSSSPSNVDPRLLDLRLDGVTGTQLPPTPPLGRGIVLRWDPFPPAPKTLEARYIEGEPETATLYFIFHDYECEVENPPDFEPKSAGR